MDNGIDIKEDFLTFHYQVKEKLGDSFSEQADLFFERAVFEAHKNLENSAIADAEYALALAQYAKDDFPILYLIGFLCEVHIFTDQISKAKFYYNLGLQLLDKNSADYDNDKASFDRLQDLMNGEDWKEKLDNNE
mgnify:FL=1|jgi:hypothetical protein